MKKTGNFLMSALALIFLFGCSQKPVKTVADLKAAYNGESTASAKYAAFAEKAKSEGFEKVSVMFLAISKSESIHAENHKKVLVKLGENVEAPTIASFTVLSTAENLADAIKGETYEVHVMYPEFILTAKTAKSNDAVKSFTWAVDTEKKHQEFYKTALEALNSGTEANLAANWYVCPSCGNTFNAGSIPNACDFCLTKKDKFLMF